MKEFNICTTCDVQHFDNCPACYGFGVLVANGLDHSMYVPTSAGAAQQLRDGARSGLLVPVPCPNCHSTIAGLPGTRLALIPHPTEFGRRRRDVITDEPYARRMAVAYIDGAYSAVGRLFATWDNNGALRTLHKIAQPTYADLRDFLRYDEGIEPLLAMAIAFEFHQRLHG